MDLVQGVHQCMLFRARHAKSLPYARLRLRLKQAEMCRLQCPGDENVHMYAGYPIDPNLKGSGGHSRFIAQDPWRMS